MSPHTPLPSLALLRCFEAAARFESYSAAAENLGMSQSAVSRHIKDLEHFVGSPLFLREGRGVRLTPHGSTLARQVWGDLDRLRDTFRQAMAVGQNHQILRLAAPPTFSARWLLPRLQSFRQMCPDLEFIVKGCSEPFDLVEARVDAAIHFGGWDWPGVQLTPLCPENLVVVAAPALAERFTGTGGLDIQDLPRLHLTSRPRLWESFFTSTERSIDGLHRGSYFDELALVISAATAGMGAAILPTYLIEDELQSEQLKQLADCPEDNSRNYYIVTPRVSQNELTHSFVSWLKKQVSNRPRLG